MLGMSIWLYLDWLAEVGDPLNATTPLAGVLD